MRKACDFYKLPSTDLLVISDDLNLKTGRIRIRPAGSAGGQNGLADIIRHLGSEDFARLRIGIDRPPEQWATTDYVLGKFNKDETEKIESAIDRATKAAVVWASEGITAAMSRYNADPKAEQDKQPTDKKTKRRSHQQKQIAADPKFADLDTTDTDTTKPESKTD